MSKSVMFLNNLRKQLDDFCVRMVRCRTAVNEPGMVTMGTIAAAGSTIQTVNVDDCARIVKLDSN